MTKPAKPVDLANLRRVIELGATDAARDAGLERFVLTVRILRVPVLETAEVLPAIEVEIVEVTEEQAQALREHADAPN